MADKSLPGGVSLEFQSLFSSVEPPSKDGTSESPVVIDMTLDEDGPGGFCAVCLEDLNKVNFLLQMKHVKECSKGNRLDGVLEQVCVNSATKSTGKQGLINGKEALIKFLQHYGYHDIIDDVIRGIGSLSNVRLMDIGQMEQATGVEGLAEKKRLLFAMEHYSQVGHLQFKKSSHLFEKRQMDGKRGSVKSLKGMWVGGKENAVVKKKKNNNINTNPSKRSVDMDKVLLDTFWKVLDCGCTKNPNSACSRLYEHGTPWCHRVVSRDQSIWYGAADCRLFLEQGSLEQRLKSGSRKAVVRTNKSIKDKVDYNTLAMKHVRLKALKDELQVHLSTVEELRSMICTLEEDITRCSTSS